MQPNYVTYVYDLFRFKNLIIDFVFQKTGIELTYHDIEYKRNDFFLNKSTVSLDNRLKLKEAEIFFGTFNDLNIYYFFRELYGFSENCNDIFGVYINSDINNKVQGTTSVFIHLPYKFYLRNNIENIKSDYLEELLK